MKLSLLVMSTGKAEGKLIPITLSQFLIGRDPQCQLRPASAAISKRHCAVLVRGQQVFVRDFDSTNGTFVNEEAVKGERELKDEDVLKVGPLSFTVKMEAGLLAPSKATPPPPTVVPVPQTADSDDESVAAMLLALQDEPGAGGPVDGQGVPTGSTVMDVLSGATETKAEDAMKGDGKQAAKKPQENTSQAAKAILEKYMRRPRG